MHESRIKINLTSTNHALKARQLFKSDFCQLLLIQKKSPCILENGSRLNKWVFQSPYVYRINSFKRQAIITFTYLFRGSFSRKLFGYDDLEQTLVYNYVFG